MVAIEVKPSQRLTELHREAHGRGNAFLVADTLLRKHLLLVQKLPDAIHFINANEEDAVCIASMYDAANKGAGKVHRRWLVEKVALGDAVPLFEEKRALYERTYVLGAPHRLRLISV